MLYQSIYVLFFFFWQLNVFVARGNLLYLHLLVVGTSSVYWTEVRSFRYWYENGSVINLLQFQQICTYYILYLNKIYDGQHFLRKLGEYSEDISTDSVGIFSYGNPPESFW